MRQIRTRNFVLVAAAAAAHGGATSSAADSGPAYCGANGNDGMARAVARSCP